MTLDRRLSKIDEALSPTQLVLRWLAEAHARIEPFRIAPAVARELLAYAGQWAAIAASEVVAIGDDPATVLAAARARGTDSPILYHVPDRSLDPRTVVATWRRAAQTVEQSLSPIALPRAFPMGLRSRVEGNPPG